MNGLLALSGAAALLLVCTILFAEECGVPLPFLPGDVLLAAGGMLVASGRLSFVLLVAASTVAMCAGALIGHAWSSALGRPALLKLGVRLGVADHIDRAARRMRSAGWVGVLVCRLIPGMRVYTNLAAGAAAVPRRTFVAGLVPSVLAWTVGFGLLGMLLGRPVVRVLDRARGAVPVSLLLLALGIGVLVAVLAVPGRGRGRRDRGSSQGVVRVTSAALFDLGVATAMAACVLEGVELVLHIGERAAFPTECLLAGLVLVAYVVVARVAGGATPGEGLLGVSYRRTDSRAAGV